MKDQLDILYRPAAFFRFLLFSLFALKHFDKVIRTEVLQQAQTHLVPLQFAEVCREVGDAALTLMNLMSQSS